MQESAQVLVQLVGAAAYKLNHIGGRGIVDSRPFQIFEGANDILYNQITESIVKQMKAHKETNLFTFLNSHNLTKRAAESLKSALNFTIDPQMTQRKYVELGKALSRIASLDLVLQLGELGFRKDLIQHANSILQQEIAQLMAQFNFNQTALVVEDYNEGSDWSKFVVV